MNRFWSLLFLCVPLLGVGTYVLAANQVWPMQGLWLPPNYSQAGETIDFLWVLIHAIGAFILLGTGLALAYSLWRFGNRARAQSACFRHNTTLEIIWTVIPGAILVFIALFQMSSWNENKLNRPTVNVGGEEVPREPLVRVVARRFGWEFYHAGPDGLHETPDDIYVENELVVPCHEDVVLQLESRDVIHSFFVPNLRLKQDIVPGLSQTVWFHATQEADTSIVCAELCGWGHYSMQARLRLVTRQEYEAWLIQQSGQVSRMVSRK